MRIRRNRTVIQLWLSASDTYNWANKAGSKWPGSTLSDKRVYAEFDEGDLIDILVNGKRDVDVDASELNALVADFIKGA